MGCLNYIEDFYQNLAEDRDLLTQRLKKNPTAWTKSHIEAVKRIKIKIKHLSCLNQADPALFKIVEIDALDKGYGGILKQVKNSKELVCFTSKQQNSTQVKYSTIKNKIFVIISCINKFQSDLINQ